MNWNIAPINREIEGELQQKIDLKTKPIGALGQLEHIALKLGLIQQSLNPELRNPHILVFAADHGVAKTGVSAYPQEVTYQMVMNFLNGGAAINVFARQHNIQLKVIDSGVNYDFAGADGLIDAKIDFGTKSFVSEPAMTQAQCIAALNEGGNLVEEAFEDACNIIGFGEMGIGNTSSASMLMHLLTDIPLEDCIGAGTGLDNNGLERKRTVLEVALDFHGKKANPMDVLSTFGGFEIAMMCGAMLKAAELKMIIMVDGFIATSAFLMASQFNKEVRDYAIFCHKSQEKGHTLLLDYINAEPILDLGMRLGEGTGCAVAFPIIQSAANFLNDMASFESAGVSNK